MLDGYRFLIMTDAGRMTQEAMELAQISHARYSIYDIVRPLAARLLLPFQQ